MRKSMLLGILILLISSGYLFADVPCKINYQGRLIKDNKPVSGTVGMKFKIFDTPDVGTGKELWSSGEIAVDVDVYNGLFRYVLGSDGGDLSSIDWTAGQVLYLEVTVDGETLSPREQIYAYPYAINSHLLEGSTKGYFINVSGEEQTKQGDLNIMGNVGIGTTSPGAKLHVGGTPGTDGIMFPDGTLQTTAGGGQRSQVVGTTNIGPPGANYVDMTDMSITMETKGGDVLLLFSASVDVSNVDGATAWIHFTVDGIKKQEMRWHNYHTRQTIASMHWLAMSLPAGSHIFRVRWKGTRIQQYGATYPRVFTAIEY